MAREEARKNRWTKSERVGEVTLFLTPRSPYWQMYWELSKPTSSRQRGGGRSFKKGVSRSTRETDLSFARLVAAKKSEELFRRRHYPEEKAEPEEKPEAEAAEAKPEPEAAEEKPEEETKE